MASLRLKLPRKPSRLKLPRDSAVVALIISVFVLTFFGHQTDTRLQQEAKGVCYRVNYLRWEIDLGWYNTWKQAQAEESYFAGPVAPGLRAVQAQAERNATIQAANIVYLPLTDCKVATTRPGSYRPPEAIPFNDLPPSEFPRLVIPPPRIP